MGQVDAEAVQILVDLDLDESFVILRIVHFTQDAISHLLDLVVKGIAHGQQLRSQVDHGIQSLLGSVKNLDLSILFCTLHEERSFRDLDHVQELENLVWGDLVLVVALIAKLLEDAPFDPLIRNRLTRLLDFFIELAADIINLFLAVLLAEGIKVGACTRLEQFLERLQSRSTS